MTKRNIPSSLKVYRQEPICIEVAGKQVLVLQYHNNYGNYGESGIRNNPSEIFLLDLFCSIQYKNGPIFWRKPPSISSHLNHDETR